MAARAALVEMVEPWCKDIRRACVGDVLVRRKGVAIDAVFLLLDGAVDVDISVAENGKVERLRYVSSKHAVLLGLEGLFGRAQWPGAVRVAGRRLGCTTADRAVAESGRTKSCHSGCSCSSDSRA